MIEKNFKIGDLIKVERKDGKIYEGIVIKKYNKRESFYCKVLNKPEGLGTANWYRFGLNESNGIYQHFDECENLNIISESQFSMSDNAKYYKTQLPDNKVSTFCVCENYGGWSNESDESKSLMESLEATKKSALKVDLNESMNLN